MAFVMTKFPKGHRIILQTYQRSSSTRPWRSSSFRSPANHLQSSRTRMVWHKWPGAARFVFLPEIIHSVFCVNHLRPRRFATPAKLVSLLRGWRAASLSALTVAFALTFASVVSVSAFRTVPGRFSTPFLAASAAAASTMALLIFGMWTTG